MSEIQVNTINEYTGANGVTIDGVLIKDGNVDGVDVSAISGNKITEVDQWRLNTSFNIGSSAVVNSNWERVDTDSTGVPIGTGVTESSGSFSFASTGKYLIILTGTFTSAGEYSSKYYLVVTTNNFTDSSPASRVFGNGGWQSGSTQLPQTSTNHFVFDVTDTSTHKFQLWGGTTTSSTSVYLDGSTSVSHTGFTVIRIGDT